jgi:hypothetical protein
VELPRGWVFIEEFFSEQIFFALNLNKAQGNLRVSRGGIHSRPIPW